MSDRAKLLTCFERLCQKHAQRLKACQQTPSEAAIHDLRISCRRLVAFLQLLDGLAPHPAQRKLRKQLKSQLDDFDELRDTQVILLEIAACQHIHPQLAAYQRHLEQRESQLLSDSTQTLQNCKTKFRHKSLKTIRQHLKAQLPNTTLTPKIYQILDQNYQTVLVRYQASDPSHPESLHRLRIALKKFRYQLAAGKDLLAAYPGTLGQNLQAYLSCLGAIQDAWVLQQALQRFFADQLADSTRQHFATQFAQLIADYQTRREEVRQFWRASPEQAFPWEGVQTT